MTKKKQEMVPAFVEVRLGREAAQSVAATLEDRAGDLARFLDGDAAKDLPPAEYSHLHRTMETYHRVAATIYRLCDNNPTETQTRKR